MHHVRTQAPYAILVGLVAIITGDLMSGYAYPTWAGLIVTIVVVLALGYLLSAPPAGEKQDLVSSFLDKIGGLGKMFSSNKSGGTALSDSSGHVIVKDVGGRGGKSDAS